MPKVWPASHFQNRRGGNFFRVFFLSIVELIKMGFEVPILFLKILLKILLPKCIIFRECGPRHAAWNLLWPSTDRTYALLGLLLKMAAKARGFLSLIHDLLCLLPELVLWQACPPGFEWGHLRMTQDSGRTYVLLF